MMLGGPFVSRAYLARRLFDAAIDSVLGRLVALTVALAVLVGLGYLAVQLAGVFR